MDVVERLDLNLKHVTSRARFTQRTGQRPSRGVLHPDHSQNGQRLLVSARGMSAPHSRSCFLSSLPLLVSGSDGTIRTSRGYLLAVSDPRAWEISSSEVQDHQP
jgi:hypothetical protein